MDTVNVSTFKATCLARLHQVKRTGRSLLVTRKGEPIAEIRPPTPSASGRPRPLFRNARFGYRTLDTLEVAVQTAKQEVQELLQELPDDATLEDIQYHIYVKQKIAQGLADVRAGRVVSQEEVEKRFARWLEK